MIEQYFLHASSSKFGPTLFPPLLPLCLYVSYYLSPSLTGPLSLSLSLNKLIIPVKLSCHRSYQSLCHFITYPAPPLTLQPLLVLSCLSTSDSTHHCPQVTQFQPIPTQYWVCIADWWTPITTTTQDPDKPKNLNLATNSLSKIKNKTNKKTCLCLSVCGYRDYFAG